MNTDRPWVTINIAMTADGKIDTIERQGAQISSQTDWERVDHLRAENDAVMVGGGTLLGEDPRLVVKAQSLRDWRLERGLEANPIKVGVVTQANLAPDSRFLLEGPARVVIFTTNQTAPKKISQLEGKGAQVFISEGYRVDLTAAMETLFKLGVKKLLVEGGGTLNAELLRLGLVDEIYIYLAPLIFSGADAPTLADGIGLSRQQAVQLKTQSIEPVDGGGVILHYLVRK